MTHEAPRDPFADDPLDPAGLFEEDEEPDPPMTLEERAGLVEEIEEVELFQVILEPRGIRGVVVDCEDCNESHYYAWDLLRENLRRLIDFGTLGVHEPAYLPDPADYVSWDYARGFTDAVLAEAEGERPAPG